MARTARGGDAPRIDELALPPLEDGAPDEIAADEYVEGRRLTGADLGGRRLQRLIVDSCEWIDVEAGDADLTDARFAETRLSRFRAPVLRAAGSEWRDVVVEESRIGSAELREAELRSVRFTRCKLGYVGLRGARLTDVVFDGCMIDELDVGGAEATRVAFLDSSVATLDVTSARLRAVDLRGLDIAVVRGIAALRGVRISAEQLAELAPLLAAEHGIDVD